MLGFTWPVREFDPKYGNLGLRQLAQLCLKSTDKERYKIREFREKE